MTLFKNHEPYPVHLFDTEERSETTVHPPFWTISTLPTGYIKCTPRDALAAFVLPGKPSNGAELFSDEPEENIIPLANLETKAPLFDQGTPARAQSGRARRSRNTSGRSSSTGSAQPRANPPKTTESNPNEKSRPSRAWSPHSKVSGSSRRMTKGADAFWAMHQSTDFTFDESIIPDLRAYLTKHLVVQDKKNLVPQARAFMSRWNQRVVNTEAARSSFNGKGKQAMLNPNVNYATYSDRDACSELQGGIDYFPCPGKELALIGLFNTAVGDMVNHYVTEESNFKNYNDLHIRLFMNAPLVGAGTTDLIAAIKPKHELVRPVLFEHKPELTLHDLFNFLVALLESLTLSYDTATQKVFFTGTHASLISAPFRDYLSQIVEQLHVHRARYSVMLGWDFYVVFRLDSKRCIKVSSVVCRDPDLAKTYFTPESIKTRLGLNLKTADYQNVLNYAMTLRPDPIPLLELFVALMISPAEREEDIVNLWTNPDLDPLRPELSTVPELDGHGSAPEAAPGSEQLGTSLGENTDVTALGRTGATGDLSTGGQTRGNPDSSAEPANTLSHSPTTAALFTVNASAALYRDEDKDVRATILLPSDDIIWEQLVAGCWSSQEASRATVSASSSSSSAGPLSNVPKLIPDNEEDTKDPTSPPMEYLPNEVKAYSPTLDRHELAPWPVGPLIKKSHLDLGSYIDTGRLYHAYRGTLTTVYADDKLPETTIPVVAKYLDLGDFDDFDINLEDNAYDYNRKQAFKAILNEVNLLIRLFVHPASRYIIPQFYGLLQDTHETRCKFWVILEDCGSPADLDDPHIRQAVVHVYNILHQLARVLHGDVQSRHITVDSNGRVRIIDWEAGKSLNSYYEGERQYVLYEERKRVANLLML